MNFLLPRGYRFERFLSLWENDFHRNLHTLETDRDRQRERERERSFTLSPHHVLFCTVILPDCPCASNDEYYLKRLPMRVPLCVKGRIITCGSLSLSSYCRHDSRPHIDPDRVSWMRSIVMLGIIHGQRHVNPSDYCTRVSRVYEQEYHLWRNNLTDAKRFMKERKNTKEI